MESARRHGFPSCNFKHTSHIYVIHFIHGFIWHYKCMDLFKSIKSVCLLNTCRHNAHARTHSRTHAE